MTCYMAIPKSGKGASWYILPSQLFAGEYVQAFSLEGFQTVIRLQDYTIRKDVTP